MNQHLSILIIDDDLVDRAAIRRALRSSELIAELHEAEDGAMAMTLLARQSFDCIVLDYRLPGMDGLSMLRSMRTAGVFAPVIILTGQGDEALAVELMKAGASDYLSKARVSPETLVSSVRHALRVHGIELERIRTEARLRMLADMSRMLGASLNYHDNLRNLASFVVPQLADVCAIDVVEPDGAPQRFALAASDELRARCAFADTDMPRLDPEARHGSGHVIRTGVTEAFLEVPAELAAALALGGSQEPCPALISTICVPLMVRGNVLGAVTFARYAGRPHYDQSDLIFVEELARRVALALDNALLYQEAQEAIRTRDAFLSVAAHELKNPLTALLGYTELLQKRLATDEVPTERERRMTRVMTEQAQRLNKMISSMLDLSRLQTGQFSIERAPLDISALIYRVTEEVRPTLSTHTLTLHAPDAPIEIVGDELRLEQVFQNLILNAVKYSPEGGPIDVRLWADGTGVFLNVSDHGVGIPRESLPNIFRRFYRASNTEHMQVSGMGVGLYVVKQILEIHGGMVSVESVEGVGSTFSVWLPLVAAPVAEPA
jgi:signal transduction histidine kinase/FixJ family two-component response regulator